MKAATIPGSACHTGLDLHSDSVYVGDSGTYFIDGPAGPAKTGPELATYLASIYVANEVISFEDAVACSDHATAKLLKHKILVATNEKKSEVSSDRLPYAAKGVGAVSDCHAQFIGDTHITTAEELRAVVSNESEVTVWNHIVANVLSYFIELIDILVILITCCHLLC